MLHLTPAEILPHSFLNNVLPVLERDEDEAAEVDQADILFPTLELARPL
jgi:hypothetical protein